MTERSGIPCTLFAASAFILVFLYSLFAAAPAFSYGVLAPARTHQHVVTEAYRLLSADPAFDPSKFPKLQDILTHEGVNWKNINYTGSGLGVMPDISLLDGPGPDAKGNSPFSWHYYNPVTGEGNAPAAVKKYFYYLSEGMMGAGKESLPKAAAWSAHFLTDMYCPYHVVGMYKESAQKLLEEQLNKYKGTQHEGAVYVTDDIKGTVKLSYLAPAKSLSNDFRSDIDLFLARGEDWFDPWYYNGTSVILPPTMTPLKLATETSSHIAWETTINPGAYNLSGYDPGWKNSRPSFERPADLQGDEASRIAKSAAALTRSKLEYFFDNPQQIINHAIRGVYTMWRASFSALDLKIDTMQTGVDILVTGKIHNRSDTAMKNVQAKLTATGCSLAQENNVLTMKGINGRGDLTTGQWKVTPGKDPCKMKMQVIASCEAPDLQYVEAEAVVSQAVKPAEPEMPSPPPAVAGGVEKAVAGTWALYEIYSKNENKTSNCATVSFEDNGITGTRKYDNKPPFKFGAKWDVPPAQLKPGSRFTLSATVTNGYLHEWPGGWITITELNVPKSQTATLTVPEEGTHIQYRYNYSIRLGTCGSVLNVKYFNYIFVKPGDPIPKVSRKYER